MTRVLLSPADVDPHALGWKHAIGFEEGIRSVYGWLMEQPAPAASA